MKKKNCIVVLGPTASGKTRLACQLAFYLNGEIISADSRQVYRGLDIGTGKDLEEYVVQGRAIPYHLIDCADAGNQFYLHDFVSQMAVAFQAIREKHRLPIICGGTGLYLDALKPGFSLSRIEENKALRQELENLPKEALLAKLGTYPQTLTAKVDTSSKKRIIRGIEVAEFRMANDLPEPLVAGGLYSPGYVGVQVSLNERKEKISARLKQRLQGGLIEEVERLLKAGISHERLHGLGLEYKFVSLYLLHKLSKEQLFVQLETAIFQFAKRQMTWFRKMEREGAEILWVEPGIDPRQLAEQLRTNF